MSTLLEAPQPTYVRTEPPDASPPADGAWRGWQLALGRTFLTVALLVAWIFAYLGVLSGFEQGHAQNGLYDRFRTELALGTAPTGAPIAAGAPVALISIPRVGIKNLVVVEGSGPDQLRDGPGHARGTVLPGQTGTSVILGRALGFGGPFGSLDELRVGDTITVTTGQGRFEYAVRGARYQGDTLPPQPASGAGRLILETAYGSGPFAKVAPSDTVYFDADLREAVGPGPVAGKVATDQPMSTHYTGGQAAQLILALQALALALAGTGWLRARWSRRGAWIVGVPSVLAALWLVSTLAAGLLPNLV